MKTKTIFRFRNHQGTTEVVSNERLVFTDAYTTAWEASEKPFMIGILTFEDAAPGKTKYRREFCIGRSRTGRCTRKWDFIKVGASALTNSKRSRETVSAFGLR